MCDSWQFTSIALTIKKNTYLCGFPGASNQGSVLATVGRLPESGAGREPSHCSPEAAGHGHSLSMLVWFTPHSLTSPDSVVFPQPPIMGCRVTIYKAVYLEDTQIKECLLLINSQSPNQQLLDFLSFPLPVSGIKEAMRPHNPNCLSRTTLPSPRMWAVEHEVPPARHLLTFVSGKVTPQNDEQAQHGEHHHGHNAANHGVVHCPDRAFFACSGVCGIRRGRGM